MSIDYDKLRRELDEIQAGVHVTTRYTWADLAEELLRLHDGIETIRDRCATLAKNARATNMLGVASFTYEMEIISKALTGLLQGGTE